MIMAMIVAMVRVIMARHAMTVGCYIVAVVMAMIVAMVRMIV